MALDVGISMMQFSVDGDDGIGYRLRTTIPGTGRQAFYVVREDGQYRVLGAFNEWAGVARGVLELEKAGRLEAARKWLDWVRDDLDLGSSQDPLSRPLFPRVWSKGEQGSGAEIRHAAALLLSSNQAAEAVPLLREAFESAQKTDEKRVFALQLSAGYLEAKDSRKAADLAEGLLKDLPDSEAAFHAAVQAAWHTGDLARTERIIAENLDRFKGKPMATRPAAAAMFCMGATDRATAILAGLMDSGKAEAQDYNALAWQQLEAGSVTAATDTAIRQAMLLSESTNPNILHTLATIQAEEGKPDEARATLLQRMEFAGSEEPDDEEWYVFGRIAEQYGLPDAAKSMYAKVARPKDEATIPLTSYSLAQRRLAVLNKVPGK